MGVSAHGAVDFGDATGFSCSNPFVAGPRVSLRLPMKTVRIANGQGFWGDSVDAPLHLIEGGPIDYLGMDYLAEVTLSIMMRQKLKNPAAGYATDFIDFIRRALPQLVAKNIRVVTNAGGLNPKACREKIFEVARALGISGFKVGVVEGDDILGRLPDLLARGHGLANMDSGALLAPLVSQVTSANAYIGARPVAEALDGGALIVLCGRVTDTALALGPLVHEFGWEADDWDRLAAGTICGHILECGAQATGGNFTRWWEVPDLWRVGYPIAEVEASGSFVVTKHPGTGGMVTVDTVSEQLVYEMGDPQSYITPDVTADFTSIRLAQEGVDRVRVSGISWPGEDAVPQDFGLVPRRLQGGRPGHGLRPARHREGPARGGDRLEAARTRRGHLRAGRPGDRVARSLRRLAGDPRGARRSAGSRIAPRGEGRRSLQGRSLRQGDRAARDRRSAGRHRLRRWPAQGTGGRRLLAGAPRAGGDRTHARSLRGGDLTALVAVPLSRVAHARSGDKGDASNVGLVAYSPALYEVLVREVTVDRVRRHFREICRGEVERFEVPNLLALNFLLHDALGGGGTASLLTDAQGKTHGQGMLEMEIEVPGELL